MDLLLWLALGFLILIMALMVRLLLRSTRYSQRWLFPEGVDEVVRRIDEGTSGGEIMNIREEVLRKRGSK